MTERLEKFRSAWIIHPEFKRVTDKLIDAIYGDPEHPIVSVMGPPGVGKTSLIKHILARIISEERTQMEVDREYIPVVGVRVPSPEQRVFPWRDNYHNMIEALFDPASRAGVHFREYKTKEHQRGLGFEFPTEKYLGRGTKQSLYRHLLRILEHRKPKAILMDEAHHYVFGVRNVDERMQVLANRLKSMADEMSPTKMVLVGTYDMHKCLEATTQGTRRMQIINFGRYQYPDLSDASDPFMLSLLAFNDMLSGEVDFNLIDHVEEIYRGCLGCIGILKSWLEYALEAAGGDTISLELFRDSKMKERFLSRAMGEIMKGEAYMATLDQPEESLWQAFAPRAVNWTKKKPLKSKKKPFQANPRAHKLGFHHGK